MYELIISEKPAAAEKIALALADKNVKKESRNGVPYFILTRKGRKIVVGCAAGHLFALAEKVKSKSLSYPVFDIEWLPVFLVDKSARFTKAYYDALRALAKGAEIFTVATDYDVEGEVIGLNIIRYICNRNDARRMKFSTLTKPDLVAAYERV
ncbi:MAG: toprim domain-containing protein, partial [Candidatus Woesearchaeota archaeon]